MRLILGEIEGPLVLDLGLVTFTWFPDYSVSHYQRAGGEGGGDANLE